MKKSLSATLRGKEYQKRPLASLEQIRVRGDQLLQAAQESHITDTQQKLDMVLKGQCPDALKDLLPQPNLCRKHSGTALSFLEQKETGTNVRDITEKVTSVLEKLNEREANDAFLRNKLLHVLIEAEQEKKRDLEEKRKFKGMCQDSCELSFAIAKLIYFQDLEDNLLRLNVHVEELREQARTPSPRLFPQPPSPHAPSQAILTSLPHMPVYMPSSLHPYMAHNLMVPLASPWNSGEWFHIPFPGQYRQISSSTEPHPETLDIARIRSLLQIHDSFDDLGTQEILENERRSIPFRERHKADLIVSTPQFHDWMVSNKPGELLVHGDFRGPQSSLAHVSAISVFCATLTKTLRVQGQQHIVLVFYCGCHMERDDQHRGAKSMIRSFAAQLVRSSVFDDVAQVRLQCQLDSQGLLEAASRSGSLSQLHQLFESLVRLLPEQITLICLIDGISHYETDDFEDEVLSTINFLLGLVRSDNTAACIKVLATSPTTTDMVQHKFRNDEKSFISLAAIRNLGHALGLSQWEDNSDDASTSSDSDVSEDSNEDMF